MVGAGLEVGILGPAVVHGPAGPVALPARTERAMVAALAAREGRVVTAASLAADVWGDDGDTDQRLVVTVSRLRRRLEQGLGSRGRALVETVPNGYRLDIAGAVLDASRFAELAADGHSRLDRGEPAAAQRALDAALALWRGDPLPELERSSTALAAVARLTAMRDAAVDARIETSLVLGENDVVIARVEALLVDDPFREARWAQLMLALYRAGRQAEALRCFQRARRVLADELGVEPGPDLRRLEAAVLAHDPMLRAASARRPLAERPEGGGALARAVGGAQWVEQQREVPRAGRDDELALLLEDWSALAQGRGGVVVVEGDPGVGKTRLAAELAHEVMAAGGEVLRTACTPGAGLVALMPWAAALGFDVPDAPPGSPALASFGFEVADHLATVADRRPTLLVLDDAQWADEATVAFLTQLGERPLPIPGVTPLLAVMLLQRGGDRPVGWPRLTATMERVATHRRVTLGPLGADEARAVAASVLGPASTDLLVDRVVAEAGGNATALVDEARAVRRAPPSEDEALPVPPALLEAFAERVDRERGEVGTVVLAAAVVGEVADLEELVAASALGEEVVLRSLERAVAARLLDPVPGGGVVHRFRFPLERRLAVALVSPARRARIEGRLGR